MLKLDKNKKYLLACSYGPDSMACFDMLLKEGYNFAVAHVNYHFRNESNQEEQELRRYCEQNKIEIHVYDNKEEVKSNLEERAREIRYRFFAELCHEYGYEMVVVAHNKDDKIETFLLQKQRKNLPIFYGINEKSMVNNINIVRPLLDTYKEDLLKYCNDNNIPYCIDQTNLENSYQRNKIRNTYLSKLSIEEKEELVKEIDTRNDKLEIIKCKLNSIDLNDIKSLLELDEKEFAYAIVRLIRKVVTDYECSLRFASEVRKVCLSDKPNVILPINDEYSLVKEYDNLCVRKLLSSFGPIEVDSPRLIDNDLFYFDLVKAVEAKGIKEYPLVIRPAHQGDKYQINNYQVSVRRLFIDWKMPKYLRSIWPVFEHQGRIVYIPRYRNDFDISKDKDFYIKYGFSMKK